MYVNIIYYTHIQIYVLQATCYSSSNHTTGNIPKEMCIIY